MEDLLQEPTTFSKSESHDIYGNKNEFSNWSVKTYQEYNIFVDSRIRTDYWDFRLTLEMKRR